MTCPLNTFAHAGRLALGLVLVSSVAAWAAPTAPPASAAPTSSPAQDPPAQVGRFSWLAGDVQLRSGANHASQAAQGNWPVTRGDVISTGPGGRTEIWIGSTALRLDVDSQVSVTELDGDRLNLRVDRGSLALRVATPQVAQGTAIDTAAGRFTPLEAGEYRIDANGSRTTGTSWKGALGFSASAGSATVPSGELAEFSITSGQLHQVDGAAVRDDFAAFARARDAAFDGRTATRFVSPEMTGVEDLDSYGRWTQVADYGAVWMPRVDVGWAPYRDGRWAMVEPWGWTWVDDSPWGFAPFHYGRWALLEGRWGWVPGAYAARPVYAPALVGWVGGAPGLSIAFGSHVGWFPLGPRETYVPTYAVSNRYLRNVNVGNVTNINIHDISVTRPAHYQYQANPKAVTVVQASVLNGHQPVARNVIPVGDPRVHDLLARPALAKAAPLAEPVRSARAEPEPAIVAHRMPRDDERRVPPERERGLGRATPQQAAEPGPGHAAQREHERAERQRERDHEHAER